MSLRLGSQVWPDRGVLVPIPGPEQPISSQEDTRGVDQSLRAPTQRDGLLWSLACAFSPRDKPKFTGGRRCPGGILAQIQVIEFLRGATTMSAPPARRVRANCRRRGDEKAIGVSR